MVWSACGFGFCGFAFAAFPGLFFLFCGGFAGFGFAVFESLRGVHGAAAVVGSAIAGAGVVAAVVEAVVVGDFAVGGDVAEGDDPDVAVVFGGLGVAVAAVVDEHGAAEAIDDGCAVAESKEVGDGVVLVKDVGFLFADVAAGVLDDAFAFADGRGGVAAGGVDGG